jgi:hypothetical protein
MYATTRRLTGDKDSRLGMGLKDRTHSVLQMFFAKATRTNVTQKAHQILFAHGRHSIEVAAALKSHASDVLERWRKRRLFQIAKKVLQ